MKPAVTNRFRRPVAAIAVAIVAWTTAGAQEPVSPGATPAAAVDSPAPTTPLVLSAKPPYAPLENELALYSSVESPWAELRANHVIELRLFGLMRIEVRLWDLQRQLSAPPENPARGDVADIARIIHAQILAGAAEALPLLQNTPNKAFARLLVHQLESYPYEWREEGSETLLPSLRKLADPPDEHVGRRRRRRSNGDD